jgi:DNA repair exonuclease SbcCD ATPase subunit
MKQKYIHFSREVFMRIEKLEIQNLFGFKEKRTYTLGDKIFAIFGKNGSGKTSFIGAVQFLFTGAPSRNLLHYGAQNGFVECTLDTGDVIVREAVRTDASLSVKTTLNGKAVSNTNATAYLASLSGADKDTVKNLVLPYQLDENIGKVLLSYIDHGLKKDDILCLAVQAEAENRHLTKTDIRAELDKLEDREYLLPEMNQFYKRCMTERKNLKAQGRALSARYEGLKAAGKVEGLDKDALQKELYALSAQKLSLDANTKLYRTWMEQNRRRVEMLAKIKDLTRQRDQFEKPEKKGGPDTAEKDLRMVQNEIQNNRISMERIRTEVKSLTEFSARLKESKCPFSTDEFHISCATDMGGILSDISKRLEARKTELSGLEKKQQELTEKEAAASKAVAQFAAKQEAARKWDDLDKRIRDLTAVLPAEMEKPDLPEGGMDAKAIDEKIKNIQNRLDLIKKQEEAASVKETMLAVAKKVYLADAFAKAFAPDGYLASELIGAYAGRLTEIAAKSGSVTGMNTVFRHQDGKINAWFDTGDGNVRPFELLSAAEKIMASYTVMDILMRLCGFPVCMVDDLDRLDADSMNSFLGLVSKNRDSYGNIILCGVQHEETKALLAAHGVAIQKL